MTETERKALALLHECGWGGAHLRRTWNPRYEALCRAIERHEAFAQEVSDAVKAYIDLDRQDGWLGFDHFIITKPDPLVEALTELHWAYDDNGCEMADELRKAVEARGGKIVWGDGE